MPADRCRRRRQGQAGPVQLGELARPIARPWPTSTSSAARLVPADTTGTR
jgi:hypothetical protein